MRHIYSTYKEHYKALIFHGLPIVIGQIGVIVLGFADTLMIGHHSTIELGEQLPSSIMCSIWRLFSVRVFRMG